jgi:hypothetical protein
MDLSLAADPEAVEEGYVPGSSSADDDLRGKW